MCFYITFILTFYYIAAEATYPNFTRRGTPQATWTVTTLLRKLYKRGS